MHNHNSQDVRDFPEIRRQFHDENAEKCTKIVEELIKDAYLTLTGSCDSPDCLRDLITLRKRVSEEGLSFLAVALPRLAEGLFNFLEYGEATYPNFKIKFGTNYPLFLGRIFDVVYSNGGQSESAITAIKLIYQVSVAFKKLRGPSKPNMLDRQIEDFKSVDRNLPDLPVDEDCVKILDYAKEICDEVFKDFNSERKKHTYLPRPGPGATNEPVPHYLRFRPHKMYKQIQDVFPYEDWFYSHPWDVNNNTKAYLSMLKNMEAFPCVRYKTVPKQYNKDRGICIEENETQFFQQALKNAFYEHIEKHPLTRGYINFTSQNVNRDLALLASETRDYATLDMKEASDRVSKQVVLRLYEGNEELTDQLMALSSYRITFPKGMKKHSPITPRKYAAMGSGLCFPVMSFVHFALIKAIFRRCAEIYNLPTLSEEPVWVYGDDIIVPSYLVADVYHYLPMFGMKFNEKKSFVTSGFRESCGVHAYKGIDITPVYFKYTPNLNVPGSLLSGFANEYDLHKRGYAKTAKCLRVMINDCFGNAMPYIGRESSILGFIRDGATDIPKLRMSLRYRFKKTMPLCPLIDEWVELDTRLEFLAWKAIPVRDVDPPFDEVDGYLRYLVTSSREHDNNYGIVSKVILRKRWVSEQSC